MLKRNLVPEVTMPVIAPPATSSFDRISLLLQSSIPSTNNNTAIMGLQQLSTALQLFPPRQQMRAAVIEPQSNPAPTTFQQQSLIGLLNDSTRAQVLRMLALQLEQTEALQRQIRERILRSSPVQPITPSGTMTPDLVDNDTHSKVSCDSPTSERSVMMEDSCWTFETPAKKAKLSSAEKSSEKQPKPPKKDRSSAKKKDAKWLSMLDKLREYKEVNGNCIVPRGYSSDTKLASWVAEQRKQYKLLQDGKQSSITTERISQLEALGFAWNAQEAAWKRHMTCLKKFREQTGHCHVPLNHPDFPKLGLWVKEQRRHYTLLKQGKPSHMTPERAEQLSALNFVWDTHEETWLERFRELAKFREKNGTCLVSTNNSDNPKLGTWCHHQRRQYKKFKEGKPCHITDERIAALESLGFVWYPREGGGANSSSDLSATGSISDSDTDSLDFRPRKRQRSP